MMNLNISFANLVIWIIVGGLAGLLGDIAVGVIGAFLGGLVLSHVLPGVYAFTGGFTGFSLGSLIVAFIGAVILLLVVRLFTARRLHSTT